LWHRGDSGVTGKSHLRANSTMVDFARHANSTMVGFARRQTSPWWGLPGQTSPVLFCAFFTAVDFARHANFTMVGFARANFTCAFLNHSGVCMPRKFYLPIFTCCCNFNCHST